MSDEAPQATVLPSAPADIQPAGAETIPEPEVEEAATTNGAISNGVEPSAEVATDAPKVEGILLFFFVPI